MEEEMSMQGNLEINKKDNYVLISVNPKIYPVDVVLSSAYIFTDSCYVLVDGDPNEEIIVELRPKKEGDIEKIGRDFNNELVNYANYAVQAIKNSRLREAILNRVLLTNSVQSEEEFNENAYGAPQQTSELCEEDNKVLTNEPDEDIDDPLEIAKPWEEKYGEKESVKTEETPAELEEEQDFEDPEGIAIPWEEKYGKDKDKQK